MLLIQYRTIQVIIISADDVTFTNKFEAYANSPEDRSNYVLKLEIHILLCADDKIELAGHGKNCFQKQFVDLRSHLGLKWLLRLN